MRILEIYAGNSPQSDKGNTYLNILPQALSSLGHDVFTLHTAHLESNLARNVIREHKQQGAIRCFKLINSFIYPGKPPGDGSGTRTPLRDCMPKAELASSFGDFLDALRPNVCHIQNIFGFPVGLVDEIKRRSIRVVATLHDYTPICPTSHLFLKSGRACFLRKEELECSSCCETSRSYPQFALEETFRKLLNKTRNKGALWTLIARVRNTLSGLLKAFNKPLDTKGYQERLEHMISFLQKLDMVHCISEVQARRLQETTGKLHNLKVLSLTPPGMERLERISRVRDDHHLMTFSVLNVQQGRIDKGYSFLREAIISLEMRRKDFRVLWYATGESTECLKYCGTYLRSDLDKIASSSDFCIIPSLWYETLAFTGAEMMARGVPLICSKRAGVSEHVRQGFDGLLFEPTDPNILTALLEHVLDNQERYLTWRNSSDDAPKWNCTFEDHVKELYSNILS